MLLMVVMGTDFRCEFFISDVNQVPIYMVLEVTYFVNGFLYKEE
jgi:hypothetical protein